MFALVDGNTFFVSCQRVFQPDLKGRPVVTLSNNDGCVIALSSEAKALGIQMTDPAFKIRGLLKTHHVKVFSGNLELYCDMSARMIKILKEFTPRLEQYSIDEAFLDLSSIPKQDLEPLGHEIKDHIDRRLGLPVCVGIGATKTLAKLANGFSKKESCLKGVYFYDVHQSPATLGLVDVADIWGVGPSFAKSLKRAHINTAHDFYAASPSFIRKARGVVGARIQQELRGVSCDPLVEAPPQKKSILVSRSFKEPTTCLKNVRESVATRIVRAAEKLRAAQLLARDLTVFITTTRFTRGSPYKGTLTLPLLNPTNETPLLLKQALIMCDLLYKEGYTFKKSGVMLGGLCKEGTLPPSLFSWETLESKRQRTGGAQKLLEALDQLNGHYGRTCVIWGATGLQKPWQPIPAQASPRYTTRFDEILVVK